jgi:hypothetical protein
MSSIRSTTTTEKRRRFPQEELPARLRRYEENLRRHGVNIEAINSEAGDTVIFDLPMSKTATPGPKADSSATTPNNNLKSLPTRRPFGYVQKYVLSIDRDERRSQRDLSNFSHHVNYGSRSRDAEELLQGESEDEICDAPITHTFDAIATDAVEILFPSQPLQSLEDTFSDYGRHSWTITEAQKSQGLMHVATYIANALCIL